MRASTSRKDPSRAIAGADSACISSASRAAGSPSESAVCLKRDTLPDVDVGFAFLSRHWSKGYAAESAAAILDHGRRQLGLKRMVAITAPENHGSIAVLERIGLKFERMVRLAADPHDLKLFGIIFAE